MKYLVPNKQLNVISFVEETISKVSKMDDTVNFFEINFTIKKEKKET